MPNVKQADKRAAFPSYGTSGINLQEKQNKKIYKKGNHHIARIITTPISRDPQYIAVIYNTFVHTAQQIQWHSRTTSHTLPMLASYEVTFMSYSMKNDCNISGAHCISHVVLLGIRSMYHALWCTCFQEERPSYDGCQPSSFIPNTR